MFEILSYISFVILVILFIFFFTFIIGWRKIVKTVINKVSKILFTDSYQENLLELMPGLRHMGVQNALENMLRAESGDVLHRPLGSSKNWPHLDEITFIPAQTGPFPVDGNTEVDVGVVIGPKARKPLKLKIPLMISGMAYGVALSEEVRMALTTAANQAGTAINSGEGGVLPEELTQADKFILQVSKTEWSKEAEKFKKAKMIEVKLGQGATMGMGTNVSPENLTGRARDIMGLEENEKAIIHEHFFEKQTKQDLKELIDDIRKNTKGIPVGVKMGAGGKLEEDIDNLLDMGVDFISIDGGQAATLGGPPILADDFGIPTLHAVVRAANHLEKRKMKKKVSLIISGGLFTPGHFLKVLALGADAVYVGSALLFTVAHNQTHHALPFEPPTQVVWNEGKFKNDFKGEKGADAAGKFLMASTEEMKEGIRAMGKTSLSEVSKQDLVSYDYLTSKIIGIPFSFQSLESKQQERKR
jgi:glutamate synthase domain-containing protein 2